MSLIFLIMNFTISSQCVYKATLSRNVEVTTSLSRKMAQEESTHNSDDFIRIVEVIVAMTI